MPSVITFYGGVHEIGGNKFLLEDRGTKIFLDFGMQMSKANQYFTEFLNPRTYNGMGDLFAFGLLPKLKGLYRKDYAQHMGFDGSEDNEIDAVILSHAHVDHAAYIHYLRPSIPIYCSEATLLIMLFEEFDDQKYVQPFGLQHYRQQAKNSYQSRSTIIERKVAITFA